MRKNVIFIHCALLPRWDTILTNFMEKIIHSGLYNEVEHIYINCIGTINDYQNFHYNNFDKITTYVNGISLDTFEISTQELLHDFAKKNENYNILYLHTKGVGKEINECIEDWVAYMSYFLIEKWRTCLGELEKNDTIGVDLRAEPTLHYSGNFWWACSNYLSKLPSPTEFKRYPNPLNSERHNQEFWICYLKDARHKCLWDCGINCYQRHLHRYLFENYSSKSLI